MWSFKDQVEGAMESSRTTQMNLPQHGNETQIIFGYCQLSLHTGVNHRDSGAPLATPGRTRR